MRTASYCLAKAVEMETRAAAARTAAERLGYAQMAVCWRELASVAASQLRQGAEQS
jgi:alkyl sulfatase BDS1-like metallo-beta-lactamase superfamily hydrolase